jgi:hypothetical protein
MTTALTRVRLGTRTARVPALALVLAFGCAQGEAERTLGSSQGQPQTMAPAVPPTHSVPGSSLTVAPAASATAAPTASQGVGAGATAPAAIILQPTPPPTVPDLSLTTCTNVEDGSDTTALGAFTVRHDAIARRTLYSWTTASQIEELRTEPKLLTRSVSSDGEVGRAQGVIEAAAATDPMAALLNDERYANKRYAWSNPWATRLGWTGDDYGDRLLAITLRADAWIGQLTVDENGALFWAFFDTEGVAVPIEQVTASPERLAAMYFFDARSMPNCDFEFRTQGSLYREYFVCNEEMIESWSAFTPEIQAELDRGVGALEQLQQMLEDNECDVVDSCWRERLLENWGQSPLLSMLDAYQSGLAFPNDLYAPTRSNIARLLDSLRAVPFDPEPLEYRAGAEPAPDAGVGVDPTLEAGVNAAREVQ